MLANRVQSAGETRILSAVVVRHFAEGEPHNLALFDLDLGPDESLTVDLDRPRGSPVVAVEVFLRLLAYPGDRVAEAYSLAQTLLVEGLAVAEFGVIDRPSALGVGEWAVAEAPSIAIYATPA